MWIGGRRPAVVLVAAVAMIAARVCFRIVARRRWRRRRSRAGALLDRYATEGGRHGPLGRLTSVEQPVTPGPDAPLAADRELRCEFGVVYLDRSSGATTVRVDDLGRHH